MVNLSSLPPEIVDRITDEVLSAVTEEMLQRMHEFEHARLGLPPPLGSELVDGEGPQVGKSFGEMMFRKFMGWPFDDDEPAPQPPSTATNGTTGAAANGETSTSSSNTATSAPKASAKEEGYEDMPPLVDDSGCEHHPKASTSSSQPAKTNGKAAFAAQSTSRQANAESDNESDGDKDALTQKKPVASTSASGSKSSPPASSDKPKFPFDFSKIKNNGVSSEPTLDALSAAKVDQAIKAADSIPAKAPKDASGKGPISSSCSCWQCTGLKVTWPEGLPLEVLVSLALVNRTFLQVARERLYREYTFEDIWELSLFVRSITSPCVFPPTFLDDDFSDPQLSDPKGKSREGTVAPTKRRTGTLADFVKDLRITFQQDTKLISMGRGGGSVICEAIEACPQLENLALLAPLLAHCKEPLYKALAKKTKIHDLLISSAKPQNNDENAFSLTLADLLTKLLSQPGYSTLKKLECLGLRTSSGSDAAHYKSLPLPVCPLVSLSLTRPDLGAYEVALLLASSKVSLRSFALRVPTSRMTRLTLVKLLQGLSKHLLQLILTLSPQWHRVRPILNDRGNPMANMTTDPNKAPFLLDYIFKAGGLQKLKGLWFGGPGVASSHMLSWLPESIQIMAWSECKYFMPNMFASFIMSDRTRRTPKKPSLIAKKDAKTADGQPIDKIKGLPNLKCASVGPDYYDWTENQMEAVSANCRKRRVCFHPNSTQTWPGKSTGLEQMMNRDAEDGDENWYDDEDEDEGDIGDPDNPLGPEVSQFASLLGLPLGFGLGGSLPGPPPYVNQANTSGHSAPSNAHTHPTNLSSGSGAFPPAPPAAPTAGPRSPRCSSAASSSAANTWLGASKTSNGPGPSGETRASSTLNPHAANFTSGSRTSSGRKSASSSSTSAPQASSSSSANKASMSTAAGSALLAEASKPKGKGRSKDKVSEAGPSEAISKSTSSPANSAAAPLTAFDYLQNGFNNLYGLTTPVSSGTSAPSTSGSSRSPLPQPASASRPATSSNATGSPNKAGSQGMFSAGSGFKFGNIFGGGGAGASKGKGSGNPSRWSSGIA